jgi:hypothetical protein
VQSTIIYTVGIKLFMYLVANKGTSWWKGEVAVFFVCAAATVAFGEIMHRAVDLPGRQLAHLSWKWIRE